jgi:thiol:disulfide interchange protein DsbD
MRAFVLALLVAFTAAPVLAEGAAPVASAWAAPAPDTIGAPSCAVDGPEVLPFVAEQPTLQQRLKNAMASGNFAVAAILVLLGGLLTALSPCVYPLIPITLSILGARQASSPVQGFLLASTYVGGMVLLYSTLGVAFAAAGFLAGSALQSPWVTIAVALFCIFMAASMFGAFELALPASLQTRLSRAGGRGFQGAFIMGLVAGVIAAPCTGPVLSFILTLIARDGNLGKGAALMFFYALGMGLPFLVLGTFSSAISRMPKSGAWMEIVKSVFGLLMLGAGLYYLQIGLPAVKDAAEPLAARGAVLGPLLLVVGVALGALHLSFKYSSVAHKVRKGLGVVVATFGLLAFLSWANGEHAPISTVEPIAWREIGEKNTDAVALVEAALLEAKNTCKPVMIDFFADWCVACKELDKFTYVDDDVRTEAQRFVSMKVDATTGAAHIDALQKRFGVVGLPTVIFVSSRGTVLNDPRVNEFMKAEDYLRQQKRVR